MWGIPGELAVGLAGGALGWMLAQILLVPRLRWSPQIALSSGEHGQPVDRYRIKVKNASWVRSIIDLELRARVYVRVPVDDDLVGTRGKSIPLGTSPSTFRMLRPRSHGVIDVNPNEIQEQTAERLRQLGLGHLVAGGPHSLEDFLSATEDAYFSIQLLAHDAWTGTQRYLQSPHYFIKDGVSPVVDGSFSADARRSEQWRIEFNKWQRRWPTRVNRLRFQRWLNPDLEVRGPQEDGDR